MFLRLENIAVCVRDISLCISSILYRSLLSRLVGLLYYILSVSVSVLKGENPTARRVPHAAQLK